jgi:hypothetical protein
MTNDRVASRQFERQLKVKHDDDSV